MDALADTPERAAIRDAVRAALRPLRRRLLVRARPDCHVSRSNSTRPSPTAGWLGIAMPEDYGGAGLGVTEAAIMMQTVANSAGPSPPVRRCTSTCSARIRRGARHRRAEGAHAAAAIDGKVRACFGVTEPDAGLDTTQLKTRAVRDGDRYVVDGRRSGPARAQHADKILLIARTTPVEQCARPTDGLTPVLHRPRPRYVEVREIRKMGREAVDSNSCSSTACAIPVDDRIGEEGKGFRYILDSLNPERILIAAEAVGIGRRALARRDDYAKERVVFGRPIGKNQAIQHPLAECWMELEAAELMVLQAARALRRRRALRRGGERRQVSRGRGRLRRLRPCVRTHGGMGYASEYHVERYFREACCRGSRRYARADPVLHRRAGARPAEVVLAGWPIFPPRSCASAAPRASGATAASGRAATGARGRHRLPGVRLSRRADDVDPGRARA